jgi:ABC-type antimicrobial peptide transport system permease subunit
MGFSKAQGLRAFMYEAFAVVLSAVILGSAVGVITASLVTAQLILFFQFPFTLSFPYEVLIAMLFMAAATTYYAVYIPVQAVNDREVSAIIKGVNI